MKKRLHIIITGRVQGVFFRQHIQDNARPLEVTGWVRNTANGGVEAVLEGEEEALQKMIAYCRKGPLHASVETVKDEWQDYIEEFEEFEIRYT